MRNLLIILLGLSVVFICSCCWIGDAVLGEDFAEGLGEAVAEAVITAYLDDVMVQTMSMQAYYVEYDRWPQDQNDLAVFCYGRNWQYPGQFWKTCSNASFEVLDDDSLSYKYTMTLQNSDGKTGAITYSSKVQKPAASREELEEAMQELLLYREDMKESMQKKP